MHHDQNIIANSSKIAAQSLILLASFSPSILVSSHDSFKKQNSILARIQIDITNTCVISLSKTIKYCIYCKKNNYCDDKYHVKHLNFIPCLNSAKAITKCQQKQRNLNEKRDLVKEEDQMAHFAENKLISFVSSKYFSNTFIYFRCLGLGL